MENQKLDQLQIDDIRLDNEVKQQFGEAAKWSKFIAVVVFVFLGIFLVFGVIGSTVMMSTFGRLNQSLDAIADLGSGVFIAIIILVLAMVGVIYFFLHRFATKIKLAIATEDNNLLVEALSALKIFFIVTTIISAISLASSFFSLFK